MILQEGIRCLPVLFISSYKNKIAQRHHLKRCAPTRRELLEVVLPNLFQALIYQLKISIFFLQYFYTLFRQISFYSKQYDSFSHSGNTIIKHKQRTDYKNLFFLPTNSSSCMLLLNAHKWPRNPTSLGLERHLRELLLIFTRQFLKK